MAEYAANAANTSPQKEYGYRNGQLLVTVSLGTVGWGAAPVFDDNPLNPNYPGETTVQARHITQLRTAINSVRSHLGLAAYSWQYSATTNDLISANPILEMRTALDQALGAPPSPGYAAGLAPNQPIKAIHIQELRGRVLAAWNSGTTGTDIRWLIADQLGTPRIILDQSGSLATTTRHDYLPFGEELSAGGRTTANGYTNSDTTRQKFTGYEHDGETGLDYAHARYYANAQGRFTGVDPISGQLGNPQSFNGYAYVGNNPVNTTDPSGMNYFDGVNDEEFYRRGMLADEIGPALAAHNQRLNNTLDTTAANRGLAKGDYVSVAAILQRNSEVGLCVGSLELYGESATTFLDGYSQPVEIAQRMGIPPGAVGYAVQKGLQALAQLVQKRRKPDFYIFTAAAANVQGSVALTRACTLTVSLGGTVGNVATLMAGWILQVDKPLDEDVVGFLTGPSGGADIFWNPKTGWGSGIGGGAIRSPESPGTKWAVTAGLGVGGGFSTSYGVTWSDLTRHFFPGHH